MPTLKSPAVTAQVPEIRWRVSLAIGSFALSAMAAARLMSRLMLYYTIHVKAKAK
jgi:hypothetical protein